MSDARTPPSTNSGIETLADGTTYIPASRRADGSTRREIRVRPGYRPPEDVATYKNRSAEAWKNKGNVVPGAEGATPVTGPGENKSKNARRREAARKKGQEGASSEKLVSAMATHTMTDDEAAIEQWKNPDNLVLNQSAADEEEIERQKKIRNQLKKLKAVQELKSRKIAGEKLSHDQLVKIGKETELLRDLRKLKYDGSETTDSLPSQSEIEVTNGVGGDR